MSTDPVSVSRSGGRTHELKTWPGYFQKVADGRKNFEARVNDRVFHEGDVVVLREWNPDTKSYTGRSLTKHVGYVAHAVDRLPRPEVVREHGISVFALLDPPKRRRFWRRAHA